MWLAPKRILQHRLITKNRDLYRLRAVEKRHPSALVEESRVEEDKQEYQKMLDLLLEAHQLGELRATSRLGLNHYYGLGPKAMYHRLLEGEQFSDDNITLTQENGRIYSFDSESNIKKDITEECKIAGGIAPNKELAYKFIKEAADKGYKPAIVHIRDLFKKLEYADPLAEEIKPINGFEGTFVDFLNVILPNLNGKYRTIENLAGDYPYATVYSQSTEKWSIRSGVIEGYLHKNRDRILKMNWEVKDLEK